MTDRWIYSFANGVSEFHTDAKHLIGPEARARLGGKGSSLHAMTAFGLPVPPGFTVVTDACRLYYDNGKQWPTGLSEQVAGQLKQLEAATGRTFGAPEKAARLEVSVRSGAAESMPGMMDTVLNVGDPARSDPAEQLRHAIDEVFRSWMNDRAVAYRAQKKIIGLAGTAVTVQAMCHADSAGVLFTINPNNGAENEIIIETVPGLGESLVLGAVVPDNDVLARPELTVKSRRPFKPESPVLTPMQLVELAKMGLRVEEFYGHALDIEWAFEGGKLFLLQARRVKSAVAEREALRKAEVERLAKLAASLPSENAGGTLTTVWSRYNLAETLPRPMPMTWSLMKAFHAAGGGAFELRRRAGFVPDLPVGESFVTLICGRLYYDLAREAQTFFAGYPFGFDFAAMKADPKLALYPRPELRNAGILTRLSFLWRGFMADRALKSAREETADRLEKDVFPRIVAEHTAERARDLRGLSDAEVIALFRQRSRKYWHELGAEAFLATLLADYSLEQLKTALVNALEATEGEKLAAKAAAAGVHSTTGDFNRMLGEVAAGRRSREEFLTAHGHRATDELELAVPRWREDASAVEEMLARFRDAKPGVTTHKPDEPAKPAGDASDEDPLAREIGDRCGMVWGTQALKELEWVRRYLPFRETAKHYVMLGYELIRLALLELDRRWELHGGIFWLEDGELEAARTWPDLKDIVAKRRHERELLLKVALPDVIFSDALEQIGNPPPPPNAKVFRGLAVSPGVAEGPAKLVLDPATDKPTGQGYILVCPSTDPGWTPLFVNAAGLVLERGGMLSHGSLVAREFHLPAVAGVDQITRAVRDGQRVRVNGDDGSIHLLEDAQS